MNRRTLMLAFAAAAALTVGAQPVTAQAPQRATIVVYRSPT